MSGRRRKSYRELVESDIEILPLMNLFVVLIPMLLLSAVFLELAVIDIHAPSDSQAQEEQKPKKNLKLAITIDDDRYVVKGSGIKTRYVERDDEAAPVELAKILADLVRQYPGNEDVRILSHADTRYDDIITVMDVSRDSGLPGVSLLAAGR